MQNTLFKVNCTFALYQLSDFASFWPRGYNFIAALLIIMSLACRDIIYVVQFLMTILCSNNGIALREKLAHSDFLIVHNEKMGYFN